MIGNTALQYEL